MHSTKYVYIFTLILTSVTAVILAGLYTVLRPIHIQNEKVYNQRQVLSSIDEYLTTKSADLSVEELKGIFTNMEQLAIKADGSVVESLKAEEVKMEDEEKKTDMSERQYPLFVYDAGDKGKFYIVSVRGVGLWDKIWGYIALKDDLNTIGGVAFDHKGETPGLGAEIKDNPNFPAAFVGKQLFKEDDYVSVQVVKAVKDKKHEVRTITGATITCNGVSDMMVEGVEKYLNYFETIKK